MSEVWDYGGEAADHQVVLAMTAAPVAPLSPTPIAFPREHFDLLQVIQVIIKWQAPRAGKMRRILCSDWLHEREKWSDTTRTGLPVLFPQ